MIPKKYIPGFPSCRVKWLERILRKIHCFLFKKYYGACILSLGKPIYIWNAPLLLSNEIVSAQPLTKISGISFKVLPAHQDTCLICGKTVPCEHVPNIERED